MEINNSVRVEKSMMSAGNCSDTGYVVDQKKKIVSLGKGNLGEIKDRLCYPKFKVSSFFTENLG